MALKKSELYSSLWSSCAAAWMRIRPGANQSTKRAIVARWYREQIKAVATDLIATWGPIIGVTVTRVFVQRMKTKWGSCNARARSIRLNTDLAKKPARCLEYIVVHELVHLLERHHNDRFTASMDRLMPHWRVYRQQLNQLPIRYEDAGH